MNAERQTEISKCGTRDCALVVRHEYVRCFPAMMWCALFFFFAPIIIVIGKLAAGQAGSWSKIGLVNLGANDPDSLGIIALVLLGVSSNILRLYLSMSLTEELFWQCSVNFSGFEKYVYNSLRPFEVLLRFICVGSMFMVAWHIDPNAPELPFAPWRNYEYYLVLCYGLCLLWDLLAFIPVWCPWAKSNKEARKMLRGWTILDGLGFIITLLYAIGIPRLSSKWTIYAMGAVTVIFIGFFVWDFRMAKVPVDQRGAENSPWKRTVRKHHYLAMLFLKDIRCVK